MQMRRRTHYRTGRGFDARDAGMKPDLVIETKDPERSQHFLTPGGIHL
jgi:hypothetical protein